MPLLVLQAPRVIPGSRLQQLLGSQVSSVPTSELQSFPVRQARQLTVGCIVFGGRRKLTYRFGRG